MKTKNRKIHEGDTTEIKCKVPSEYIGGEVRLLVLLTDDSGI